jgi:type VI secretion system protein ImpH
MAAESRPQGPDVTITVTDGDAEVSLEAPPEARPVVVSEVLPEIQAEAPPPELPEEPEDLSLIPDTRPFPGRPINEYYGAEVRKELRSDPWNFEFFQAVRLLERFGTGKPVGRFENPGDEAARFSTNSALMFPPSQINSLHWAEGKQPQMRVNFMGLVGQLGVLPLPYTEWVNTRIRAKDYTTRDFLDVFHHRMISLFYQAWEKYRFPVAYERDRDDRFTRYLLTFIGLGTDGLRRRLSVPDEALVFYTGLLGLQTRSATALRQILHDYFQVPVEIEQFVGSWRPIPESNQSRVGDEREFTEQLSLGAIAGDEVWDKQCTARVVLGPLTLREYLDFLPIGTAYKPLRELTEFFTRREIDFEVLLILRRDETPGVMLEYENPSGEPMLGWTTWLKSKPMQRDPADTVLQLQ